jgi:hypothetical protein
MKSNQETYNRVRAFFLYLMIVILLGLSFNVRAEKNILPNKEQFEREIIDEFKSEGKAIIQENQPSKGVDGITGQRKPDLVSIDEHGDCTVWETKSPREAKHKPWLNTSQNDYINECRKKYSEEYEKKKRSGKLRKKALLKERSCLAWMIVIHCQLGHYAGNYAKEWRLPQEGLCGKMASAGIIAPESEKEAIQCALRRLNLLKKWVIEVKNGKIRASGPSKDVQKQKRVSAKRKTNKAKRLLNEIKIKKAHIHDTLKTLPPSSKRIMQTGASAFVISGLGNLYSLVKNEKNIEEAFIDTLTDTAKWTIIDTATEVAPAVMQRIGDKYIISVLSHLNQNMGLFTFVFDEAHLIYNFTQVDLTLKEFISETGKNVLRASVVAGVQYICAGVAILQTIPGGGIIVSGIVIGSYFLVSTGIQYAEELNQRNYFFIEDVLGKLPLDMQNKITPFSDSKIKKTPFYVGSDKVTPFNEKTLKPSPFHEEKIKVTPFSIN